MKLQGDTISMRVEPLTVVVRCTSAPDKVNAKTRSEWSRALRVAEGRIVATFHTSTTKSLSLAVFQGVLRPWHEKIVGRIAVSDLARRWQMEALGSDAVEIPNGVDVASFASAPLLDGYPRPADSRGKPAHLRVELRSSFSE